MERRLEKIMQLNRNMFPDWLSDFYHASKSMDMNGVDFVAVVDKKAKIHLNTKLSRETKGEESDTLIPYFRIRIEDTDAKIFEQLLKFLESKRVVALNNRKFSAVVRIRRSFIQEAVT